MMYFMVMIFIDYYVESMVDVFVTGVYYIFKMCYIIFQLYIMYEIVNFFFCYVIKDVNQIFMFYLMVWVY